MIVTFIRTLIIFVTLFTVIRFMGKRQIGEMQPFEFIVTLIIADMACIPMADVSIPLIYGLASIFCLFLLHQLFAILEQVHPLLKRVISGKPSLVINKDGVDYKELRRNNLNIDDLIESMRSSGYFSLDDLSYAIFESNGKLSALENSEREPTPSALPLLIIDDKKITQKNVELIGSSKLEIQEFLRQNGHTINTTEVMTIDGNGRVYLKCKNKPYQILNFSLAQGVKW